MKIRSIDITEFGALKGLKLDFSDALNIINGKNESGKSTILLFIMYMLYGFPKSVRKSSPSAFDKERSLSWDSGRAAGSMEIEVDGCVLVISRSSAARHNQVSVIEKESGKLRSFSKEIGEELLGISRESFESCSWCGQLRASCISGEQVSQTLSNMSVSGNESINAAKALSVLRDARREYKLERGNGGLIYNTERRIAEKKAEFAQLGFDLENVNRDRAQIERWEGQLAATEQRLARAEKAREMSDTLRLLSDFDELERLEQRTNTLMKSKEALDGEFADYGILPSEQDLEALLFLQRSYKARQSDLAAISCEEEQASRLDERAIKLAETVDSGEGKDAFYARAQKERRRATRGKTEGSLICGAGVVFLALAMIFMGKTALLAIFLALSAVSFATGVAWLINTANRKKEFDSYLEGLGLSASSLHTELERAYAQYDIYLSEQKRREERAERERVALANLAYAKGEIEQKLCSFSRVGADDVIGTLDEVIADFSRYISEKRRLEREISLSVSLSEAKRKALEKYDREELASSVAHENFSRDGIELDRLDEDIRNLHSQAEAIKGKIMELRLSFERSVPKIERRRELDADIDAEELLLQNYRREYEIVDLAYSALEEANARQRSNFAPKIRAKAGELLSAISDGKYSGIFLDENFDIRVERGGVPRQVGLLSGGTADAVYLSLRMALIDSIFEQSAPLFLDESLSQLDNERAAGVLELLSAFVDGGNQCVLFTCHDRESAICDGQGIEYKLIKL